MEIRVTLVDPSEVERKFLSALGGKKLPELEEDLQIPPGNVWFSSQEEWDLTEVSPDHLRRMEVEFYAVKVTDIRPWPIEDTVDGRLVRRIIEKDKMVGEWFRDPERGTLTLRLRLRSFPKYWKGGEVLSLLNSPPLTSAERAEEEERRRRKARSEAGADKDGAWG